MIYPKAAKFSCETFELMLYKLLWDFLVDLNCNNGSNQEVWQSL